MAINTDYEFLLIILKIALSSLMIFMAVILLGKVRRLGFLFMTISLFMIFMKVIYEVLEKLNIFYIDEIRLFNLPLITYLIDYSIYIFFILSLISFLSFDKRKV